MNPYDLYALETALRLREARYGGSCHRAHHGPVLRRRPCIREAYAMGADDGCDVLRPAASAARMCWPPATRCPRASSRVGGFDLILCGKQTTDGDTAQVGPAIAEHLHLPTRPGSADRPDGARRHRGGAGAVRQDVRDREYALSLPDDGGARTSFMPRLPSPEGGAPEIREQAHPYSAGWTLFWMPTPAITACHGTPTQVERIFPPHRRRRAGNAGRSARAGGKHCTIPLRKLEVYLREERTNGTRLQIFGAQVHRLRPLRAENCPFGALEMEDGASRVERRRARCAAFA